MKASKHRDLTDVYPPFVDMLAWLERLAPGAGSEVLEIDDEVYDHFFRIERTGDADTCIFEYLQPHWSVGGLYRRTCVSFRAVVKEFLAALEYLTPSSRAAARPGGQAVLPADDRKFFLISNGEARRRRVQGLVGVQVLCVAQPRA